MKFSAFIEPEEPAESGPSKTFVTYLLHQETVCPMPNSQTEGSPLIGCL
jgi:hypothetical protein